MKKGKDGFYNKYIKRILDIICALAAMIVFCWLYAIVAILVRVKLGKPVIFKQIRPGMIDPKTGKEKLFTLYKFRTMTDECDSQGNLLPDDVRLTKFGKLLRSTSLDELPEAWNILKGDMSVIGPRPQLVRDMVFMTPEQRRRHSVRPGLSGLAQTRGRNALLWESKLETDLEYVDSISFWGDVKIVVATVLQVFFHRKGLENSDVDEAALTEDYGDYLLRCGVVNHMEYYNSQQEAKEMLFSRG